MRTLIVFLWGSLASAGLLWGQAAPAIYSSAARHHPVVADHGMVATQEAHATRAAVAILEQGGNAADAAVTAAFTLAVTLPRAGNLGGGGFALVHDSASGATLALDFRETAPAAATRDMYLDAEGDPDPQLSRFSPLAVGVPGSVAGLVSLLEEHGTMTLPEVLASAMSLALNGFPVNDDLNRSLAQAEGRLGQSPAASAIFYPSDSVPARGATFRQPVLGASLGLLAAQGQEAFYEGAIAEQIVLWMEANDGLITMDDLAAYAPVWREPVRGHYRGYTVLSMPPPSSGGIHLVQMLNLLERHDLAATGHNSAATIHLYSEVMKRAYADRSQHLGDPDFHDVPQAWLTSQTYAASLQDGLQLDRPTPSTEILPGTAPTEESPETTHLSVVDRWGNAVSLTTTLNFSYGSGLMAPGTGFLLNNEMDDFSAKPGVPNAYGLLGGEANAIEPGKRMLSSMTPTLVLDEEGDMFLVTGSPGGSRIITTVLQIILNIIDFDMNVAEATHAPRVHHQWLPDELRHERGLSPDTLRLLEEMGHTLDENSAMGSTQSILMVEGQPTGSSDPRRTDALTAGH